MSVSAASACPICFPKIAFVGSIIGLGVLAPFEGYVEKGVQALFLIPTRGFPPAWKPLVVEIVALYHPAVVQRLLRGAIKPSATACIVWVGGFQFLVGY